MRVEDYLFRFDRGAFNFAAAETWMTSWTDFLHPTKLPFYLASANNPVSRIAFGWFFATAIWQPILHRAPAAAIASQMLMQDCFIPAASASEGILAVRDATSAHKPAAACPIWTWPVRGASAPLAPNGHTPDEMLVNFGLYSRCADGSVPAVVRRLEACVAAQGGRKLLYSNNYYDRGGDKTGSAESDLWGCGGYDRAQYDALRAAYGAEELLPRIEEKVLTGAPGVDEEGGVAWQVQLARFFL